MLNNAELEQVCAELVQHQDAKGVLMLIIHKDNRAEVVAALGEEIDDLPRMLQRLANQVA